MGAWLFHQLAVCLMDNKRKKHSCYCKYLLIWRALVLLLLFVHMTSTLVLLELFVHMTSTRDMNLLSDRFRMVQRVQYNTTEQSVHMYRVLFKSTTTKRQWRNKQKLGQCQTLSSKLLYHRFHEMLLVSILQKHYIYCIEILNIPHTPANMCLGISILIW